MDMYVRYVPPNHLVLLTLLLLLAEHIYDL